MVSGNEMNSVSGCRFGVSWEKLQSNNVGGGHKLTRPLVQTLAAFCAPPGTLTLDISTSVFAEFPTVEIVGVAQAASILESAALLLVPVIVEPGDDSLTRSLVQGQEAGL